MGNREALAALAVLADEASAIIDRPDSLRDAIKEAYRVVGGPGSDKRFKIFSKPEASNA